MTILPKKKHPEGKKNETNSNNELRHSRNRNNCARTNSERTNRSPEEINDGSVYRAANLDLRGSSESTSNGKRRYRSSPNDYRRRDEAGYNSEDEYDVNNSNEQPTEEVSWTGVMSTNSLYIIFVFKFGAVIAKLFLSLFSWKVEKQFEKILKEKKGFVIKKTVEDGACLFRAVGMSSREFPHKRSQVTDILASDRERYAKIFIAN